MAKYNKIRHIVRLRQILGAWLRKATSPDFPAGHVAVCVGSSGRRFIVRATHLNHPVFRRLLRQVEEEYGFSNNQGPLAIPCDESVFEEILVHVSRTRGDSPSSESLRCCHVGTPDYSIESRPLLYEFTAR